MLELIFIIPFCIDRNNFIPLWIYLGVAFIVWCVLLIILKTSKEDIDL